MQVSGGGLQTHGYHTPTCFSSLTDLTDQLFLAFPIKGCEEEAERVFGGGGMRWGATEEANGHV